MIKKVIVSLLLLGWGSSSWAKSDGEYIAQFLIAAKKGSTISGQFSQNVLDGSGAVSPKTAGKFFVKRPGKLLWQYNGKSGQKIVSTGKRVWIEQPDLKQVAHVSVAQAMKRSPATLLFNPDALTRQFKIVPHKTDKTDQLEWVQLVPFQKKDMQFEALTVGLQGQNIKQIRVLDAFGRTVVIRLTQVQIDTALSDTLFRYQPPSDYDTL